MPKGLSAKGIVLAAILVAELVVLIAVAISAHGGPVGGLAVQAGSASLQMSDQRDVVHQVVVDRVVAPAGSWIIVQADWGNGVPDAILGSTFVPKGESRYVVVPLDPGATLPKKVFVTLLADMGAMEILEYYVPARPGMETMRGMGSTLGTGGPSGAGATKDLPYIAGGKVVRVHPSLTALTFSVGVGQASLSDTTRTVDATAVVVPRVVAPAQSWVAVSMVATGGQPAQVLGATLVPAGVHNNVSVPLRIAPGKTPVTVTLHVDLGKIRQFEFSPLDLGNSVDQPYVAGGKTVSTPVTIAH